MGVDLSTSTPVFQARADSHGSISNKKMGEGAAATSGLLAAAASRIRVLTTNLVADKQSRNGISYLTELQHEQQKCPAAKLQCPTNNNDCTPKPGKTLSLAQQNKNTESLHVAKRDYNKQTQGSRYFKHTVKVNKVAFCTEWKLNSDGSQNTRRCQVEKSCTLVKTQVCTVRGAGKKHRKRRRTFARKKSTNGDECRRQHSDNDLGGKDAAQKVC